MGRKQKPRERHYKKWTIEEEDYLKENWGCKSLASICKHLKRTENAVVVRSQRLHLGAARDSNPDYITLNSLITALYRCSSCNNGQAYMLQVRLPKFLKIYMIPQPTVKRRCVKLSEFWEFAEKNRALFDFSKLEKYELGPEPDWVDQQRRLDNQTNILIPNNGKRWSPAEDSRLKILVSRNGCSCDELAKLFQRSEGAIVRRLRDLGLYKSLKRNDDRPYWQSELDEIGAHIKRGCSYTLIAERFGRSGKSIRGMVYQRFGSESLVNARKMLLDGARLEERRHKPKKKQKDTDK